MKKIFSFLTAVLTASALCPSLSASAVDDNYSVKYYTKPISSENIRVMGDAVQIDSDLIRNGGFAMDLGVYIKDSEEILYSASAWWSCDSEYITLDNLLNPTEVSIPFCYGTVNEDGTYGVDKKYAVVTAYAPELVNNTMAFTFRYQPMGKVSGVPVLGEASDYYPFANYEAVFDANTPDGIYEIYFLTKDKTYATGTHSDGSFAINGLPKVAQIEYQNLTIIVGDYEILGDVNDDEMITPIDAAMALNCYANEATMKEAGLTGCQMFAADVNEDSMVTPIDAALILGCYAHNATTLPENSISMREYLEK